MKKRTFTLAEVLIVIGVIGVVAAITIPALINTISEKAKKSQTDVIEKRLIDGLNRFNTIDDGFSQKYTKTYDFLIGLSNHYKISAICDSADIPKCVPYAKISYETVKDGVTTAKSVDVSGLTSIGKFIKGDSKNDYLEPAAFISAQGTPFIAALKKDCVKDTGKAMTNINGGTDGNDIIGGETGCLALLYDKNGTGLPNTLGKDIAERGLTIVIPPEPKAILGGVKIMTNAFVPDPLTASDCSTNKSTYGITNCRTSDDDRWGGAMKACKEQGYRLPTDQDLADIANALYTGMQASATDKAGKSKYGTNNASIGSNEPVPDALSGLGSSWYYLWSGSEGSSSSAYFRTFYDTSSSRDYYYGRGTSEVRAICVGD